MSVTMHGGRQRGRIPCNIACNIPKADIQNIIGQPEEHKKRES